MQKPRNAWNYTITPKGRIQARLRVKTLLPITGKNFSTFRVPRYIYMLIYVNIICIPALSTNGWWFKPQGLETIICFHRLWALSGTVAQTCPRLVRCTKARIGGFSQNWRWGREPNVGAKVWKIAWEIKYHKGCVCVCVAWNCWRIFVVELWGVFFAKKRCGTLKTWVISYKGLTISHQFRIWVCAKYCWRHNPDDLRWK